MRYYSTTAGEMTLQAGITGSDTSIVVDTTAGLPSSYPYTLILDYGTSSEEVVNVTAAASTTLTVTRAQDNTIAQSHAFGATIRHGMTARDLRESREHEAASTGVHGVTGSVVGTSDTQTLTNKTLTSPTVTGGTVNPTTLQKGSVNVPTISETATLTNKDLSSGTNTFPSTLATDAEVTAAVAAHEADTTTHGATGAVVGTTNTQTLTNKTISGASNTLSAIPQSAVTSLTSDLSALTAADTALDTRVDALEAPDHAVVRPTATQSVPNASTTRLTYATTDSSSGVTVDTGAGTLTVTQDGLYVVAAGVGWTSGSTGYRAITLTQDSTSIAADTQPAFTPGGAFNNVTAIVRATAGDVFAADVYQSNGGALGTFGFADRTFLSIARLGD